MKKFNNFGLENEFFRNVFTLTTGSAVAQVIPVLITPILTRLYSPKDFGIFALYSAIIYIVGSISNGRYELAIMLPEDDSEALNVMILGIMMNVIVNLLLMVVILIFYEKILDFLGSKDVHLGIFIIPLACFFLGIFNSFIYFNNRKRLYKNLAISNVIRTSSMISTQLLLGIFNLGNYGLILGHLISYIIADLVLGVAIKPFLKFRYINKSTIIKVAKRYINFPKYSVLAILLNNLSQNLLNIFISSLYDLKILGFYSLARKTMGIPSTFIGVSVGRVYFEVATKEKSQTGKAVNAFCYTFKRMLFFSAVFFGPSFFAVTYIFKTIFGPQWVISGLYARILIPFYAIRFVLTPLMITDSIFEKQKFYLLSQIFLLILLLSLIYFSKITHIDFLSFLYLFVFLSIFFYSSYGIALYNFANGKW